MKRKLLLAAVALLCSVGMWATDYRSSLPANGVNWDLTSSGPWRGNENMKNDTPKGQCAVMSDYKFAEVYYNQTSGTVFEIYKTISVPNGVYVFQMAAFARRANIWGEDNPDTSVGVNGEVFANDATVAVTSNTFVYYTVTTVVTDGTLKVGVRAKSGNKPNWWGYADPKLILVDVSETDLTSLLVNPSFETGTDLGWTHESSSDTGVKENSDTDYTTAGVNGSYLYNTWWQGVPTTQTVANMPNGNYTLNALLASDNNAKLFLLAQDGHSDVFTITGDKTTFIDKSYDFTVSNNSVTIGAVGGTNDGTYTAAGYWWYKADNFRIKYKGDIYKTLLSEAVTKAQALVDGNTIPNAAETALQTVINNNDNDDNTFTTVANYMDAYNAINTAYDTYKVLESDYAAFLTLKTQADAIAGVSYKETTDGSHDTFTGAISAQNTAVEAATTSSAITSATTALKADIKTYIAGAEPANEGEYFDITCLMNNPDFEDSHNGWTYLAAPGVSWSNCEYYQSEFDINQTVTGLPTGSYSLSVQAFQRPGSAGDVWTAYSGGTDGASSVLYINNITSNVKNIMADAQNAGKLGSDDNWGTWPNDSRVGSEGSYKYIPNSQQGSKLYFDAGLYDATCAAVVTDEDGGSLKLGFKSTKTHVAYDWTIFDNFRLYYYGSSLLVYYKQYLPQLKSEVSADKGNALYANVLGGSENAALTTALAATPAAETEEAYKAVIDDITEKQTAFRSAAASYDALVAAKASSLTKVSANIGTGVFQYNETTNNSLYSAYETAKGNVDIYTVTTSSTAAAVQALVDALDNAISNYNNQALNAPESSKRYYLNIVDAGQAWDGNAVTFIAGGRNDMGLYGIQYLTPANTNMNQALKFTAVDGYANTYKVSAINASTGAEQYITTGNTYEGGNTSQIRTTDDASKASWVKIAATATAGQFQLLNVSADNAVIARNADNPDNGMYTSGTANFTIAEASQASVAVAVSSGKYATRIFPFAPGTIDGITFYSCNAVAEDKVTLEEVATPEANKPYILKASKDVDTSVSGWGAAGATSYTEGYLTGVYDTQSIAASVAATAETDGADRYVLQTQGGVQAFYKVDAAFTATSNRAYLTVPVAKTGSGAKARAFYFDTDATGIDAIAALVADEVEAIYTAAGVKVESLQKGLNIVVLKGGKTQKVFVK